MSPLDYCYEQLKREDNSTITQINRYSATGTFTYFTDSSNQTSQQQTIYYPTQYFPVTTANVQNNFYVHSQIYGTNSSSATINITDEPLGVAYYEEPTREAVEEARKRFEASFIPKDPITWTKLPPFEIKSNYACVRYCTACNCSFWFNGDYTDRRYNLPTCSPECIDKYFGRITPNKNQIKKAQRKANRLLRSWLSPEEYNYIKEHDELELPSKYEQDVIYIVKKDPFAKVVKKVKGVEKEQLCVTLLDSGFQKDDVILSKILLLKTNEKQFLQIANRYPIGERNEPQIQDRDYEEIRGMIHRTADVLQQRHPEAWREAEIDVRATMEQ